MKKIYIKGFCFIVILISIIILINIPPIKNQISKIINIAKKEDDEVKENVVYQILKMNKDDCQGILTIENKDGIDKVIVEDEEYYVNGNKKLAIDKKFQKNGYMNIIVKYTNESEEKYYKTEPFEDNEILVTNYNNTEDEKIRTIQINYAEVENTTKLYSIDNGKTWKEYAGTFNIDISKVEKISTKLLWNDTNTIHITPDGESITDGLLNVVKYDMDTTGYYEYNIGGQTYSIHAYVYDNDTTISSDITFGDENDAGTSGSYAQRMVVVKVKGNLTIDPNVTITSYGTGYGGPKGMLIYAEKDLINNGIITMSNKGAYAPGQNVYLWNSYIDSGYEYIPAVGAGGGGRAYNNNTYGTYRK